MKQRIEFALTEESIETQLASWIRELVQSNTELVPALERLRRSYRVLQACKPVTDAEEVLWQVERALNDAETASLIGLAPWAEGDIIIDMVAASLQSNVFHVNGHEQKRFFSRQTALGENRGSFCDNQHAR